MNTAPRSSLRVTPQIILGLLIVAFGDPDPGQPRLRRGRDILRYWPLLLVAFGLARMLAVTAPPAASLAASWSSSGSG